jgi:hypothetical protein
MVFRPFFWYRNYSSSIFGVLKCPFNGTLHYNPAFPKKLGSSQAASDSPFTSVGQLSEHILWFAEFREYITAVEIIP